MGLWALIGVSGLLQFAVAWVDIVVALGGAGDAVGEVHAGVEPLGTVWRGDLASQHVDHLVVKGLGVIGGVKVVELLAPVSPASGEAVEDLAGVGLALC